MNRRRTFVLAGVAAIIVGYGPASQADTAAGKATFTQVCAECHEVADFEGEDTAALQATITKIANGGMKHKKAFKLTDAQIADVAAYMTSGK